MTSSSITAVILSKNEEESIEKAIHSVSFAKEVLVIDDYSTDKTVSIAEKSGARVIKHKLEGDFGAARNFAMEKAENEWVFYIDADEVATEELGQEIKKAVQHNNDTKGWFIRRRDFWSGQELKYGETSTVRNSGLLRLMKKNSGKWTGRVHERFGLVGKTARLNTFLNHYPHPTVKDFILQVNEYSTLRARELFDHGTKSNFFELVAFPMGKFWYTYVFKLGFLDGFAGFVYAFMMSFHSFLVRAKLYQYWNIDTA